MHIATASTITKANVNEDKLSLPARVRKMWGPTSSTNMPKESNDQGPNQIPPVNSSENLLQETPILYKLTINSTFVTAIKVE